MPNIPGGCQVRQNTILQIQRLNRENRPSCRAQGTEPVVPKQPWNLRARAKAFSAGMVQVCEANKTP